MKGSGTTILIVEDSAIQAEKLRRTLVAEGFSVLIAKDGAEGLSKVKESKPDIVITDIMMPSMNGFELCRQIKDDKSLRTTPVILLTSLSDPADVISGLECGADNFIIKPYIESHLITRIRHIILNRELQENSRTQMGVEINFAGKKYFITSEKKQILDLLISTYESAVQKNIELIKVQEELKIANDELDQKVQERTAALSNEIEVRKKVEEDLRASEVRYRRLFEAAKDGILILEADTGMILDVNPFLIELLGYSKEIFLGKAIWELGFFSDFVANKNNFTELQQKGYVRYEDMPLETADGRRIDVEYVSNVYNVNNQMVIQCNIRNITDQKQMADLQKLSHKTLLLLNRSEVAETTIRDIVEEVKKNAGFDAVAIRLCESDDYPFYATSGFSEDFVRTETFLYARDKDGEIVRDATGTPVLECMCGNVLRVQTNPELPFFTKGGSFWTNSTTRLLASTSKEDLLARTRKRCNTEGYESVSLIPIKSGGDMLGLLQLNDHKPDKFTLDSINFLEGLASSIGVALGKKLIQEKLNEEKTFTEKALNSLKDIFYVFDSGGKFLRWNKTLNDVSGYNDREIASMKATDFFQADDKEQLLNAIHLATQVGSTSIEVPFLTKDGSLIPFEFHITLMKDYVGESSVLCGVGREIAERIKLENQLRQSQKMEAIGTLAGGIAHDFNNMLNVIIGYGSLMIDKLGDDHHLKSQMGEILAAAERAANLTKRLLLFSRKEVAEIKPVEVNEMVINLEKMLSRIIGEDIKFNTDLMDTKAFIMADPGQMEQVLMNLVTNARDAMPKGGNLTIRTELREIDSKFVEIYENEFGLPGRYAVISTSDTGIGIDKETQAKIFDPFFTTKEVGKGTGLGLSIVYGIIKQHKGIIKVYSELGKGTTFNIWLPVIEDTGALNLVVKDLTTLKGGTETILIAEDDEAIRDLTKIILESFDYTVIAAEDGEDAITKYMENRERISLVLIDMIMPKKNGKEVGDAIRAVSPLIKIVFTSGYTMDILNSQELIDDGFELLHKPYRPQELLIKVREILDR